MNSFIAALMMFGPYVTDVDIDAVRYEYANMINPCSMYLSEELPPGIEVHLPAGRIEVSRPFCFYARGSGLVGAARNETTLATTLVLKPLLGVR